MQIIDRHNPGSNTLEYTATWCKDEIMQRGKCGDGYRNGNGRYYLEASLQLLVMGAPSSLSPPPLSPLHTRARTHHHHHHHR